jgi:serpin B
MKKLLITFTIAGLLAGCSNDPVSNNSSKDPKAKFAINRLDVDRNVVVPTDPKVLAEASSISKFAVNMYKQIVENGKNAFFSPYSITTAFGMADAGAKGNTDLEIRKALQVTLDGDDFHSGLNGLDQSLISFSDATENLELNVENSVWAQDSVTYFKIGYLDKLARNYGAGIYMLDFMNEPDPSRIIINDWVAKKTNERIKDLIPPNAIDASTRLVLTNAIYFLADWEYKFDSNLTVQDTFYTSDGNSIKTSMMNFHDEPVKLLYNYSGNVRVLELPYKGNRIAMDLILPDSGTFEAFEDSVSSEGLSGLISGLDSTKLTTVQIPKFQFSTPSLSIKETLRNLGMKDPFTTAADFSGIADIHLVISDVFHKAFIKVDESGTEAAAATAIIFTETASPYPDTKFFVANRPFMYLIRDKQTNAILFMGRVMNPAVTE